VSDAALRDLHAKWGFDPRYTDLVLRVRRLSPEARQILSERLERENESLNFDWPEAQPPQDRSTDFRSWHQKEAKLQAAIHAFECVVNEWSASLPRLIQDEHYAVLEKYISEVEP
jgi:hypothetical protein